MQPEPARRMPRWAAVTLLTLLAGGPMWVGAALHQTMEAPR